MVNFSQPPTVREEKKKKKKRGNRKRKKKPCGETTRVPTLTHTDTHNELTLGLSDGVLGYDLD